jgi:hypothetical protein
VGLGDSVARRVFISYRREDSIGVAGRIRDRLVDEFGADNVFFDIDTIPLGVDFREHIDLMVAECDVVLVVIGRRWIDVVDERGARRLDQAGDFVRLEVEAALGREIPVVPLLVDGASMPDPTELPKSLSDLAYRNGTVIRYDPDFHPDVDRLLRRLAPVASPSAGPDTAVALGELADAPASVGPSHTSPRPGLAILNGHTRQVSGCAVAPDGTWIVSASLDETLRIWDAVTGECRRTLEGHTEAVLGCEVAADCAWIVSASLDQTLRVWDAATGVTRRTLEGHAKAVCGCAVSVDCAWIVSASVDDTLRIWDAVTGETRRTMEGHTEAVCGCAVDPDGTWIVSASDDNTLRIWDAASGRPIGTG